MAWRLHAALLAVVLLAGCTTAPPGTEQLPGRIYFGAKQTLTMIEGGWQGTVSLPDGITIDQISPDGRHLTGTDGKRAVLFRLDGTTLEQVAELDSGAPASWAPDGSRLAAVAQDGKVRIFDLAGKLLREFPIGAREGQPLTWSPDGQSLIAPVSNSMVDEGGLRLIQLKDGTVTSLGMGTTDPAWSPDGRRLAYAVYDGKVGSIVVRTDGDARALLTEAIVHPTQPDLFERNRFVPFSGWWSPGGDRILTVFKAYGPVDPLFGVIVQAVDGSPPQVALLPVHPDHPQNANQYPRRPCTPSPALWAAQGERVIIKLAGFGCEGQLWIADGHTLKTLTELKVDPDADLSVSPDGSWMALAGKEGTTTFQPLTGGQAPVTVKGLGALIRWSPAK